MDLDEKQLTHIADVTHGRYFRARNSQELDQIYQEIDKLEPVSRDQLSYRPQVDLFYWPLALALLTSLWIALGQFPLFASWGKRPNLTRSRREN